MTELKVSAHMAPMLKSPATDTLPDVFENWHPTLNGNIDPGTVGRGSRTHYWWDCPKHGPYRQTPTKRAAGHRCLKCGIESMAAIKSTPRPGRSIAEVSPAAAATWHPTLNGDLTPSGVAAGSDKELWWDCPQHGPYRQAGDSRAKGSIGCPKCRRTPREPLSATNPDLVGEWHPELNGGFTPDDVSRGSTYKAWWLCQAHGAFQSQVRARAVQGSGCSKCSRENRRSRIALADEHPELAAQWHPELNGDKTPQNVSRGSDYHAWWVCPEHGEYRMRVWARATCGQGCQKCGQAKSVGARQRASSERQRLAAA